MVRKIFIFLLFSVILLLYSSYTVAQDCRKDALSVSDLKERVRKVQRIIDDAEKGIIESDRILMKAKEIILLARARGDVKAGQVAEEAAKRAEKAREEHKKNKAQAEKQIAYLNAIINEMEKKSINTLAELCEAKKLKYEQVRNHLMGYIKEAEITVQEFEKIQKEAEEAKKEAYLAITEELLPIGIDFLNAILDQEKLYRSLGKLAKNLQHSHVLGDKGKKYSQKTKEWIWKIGNLIREKEGYWYSQYLKNKDKIALIESSIPPLNSAEFAGEHYGYIKAHLEAILNDCEEMEKASREALDVIDILESQDFKDVLSDLLVAGLNQEARELEMLAKELKKNGKMLSRFKSSLKDAIPVIDHSYRLANAAYFAALAFFLESETNRLHKVIDPERANFWINEHKKAYEEYRKCKEFLKSCHK